MLGMKPKGRDSCEIPQETPLDDILYDRGHGYRALRRCPCAIRYGEEYTLAPTATAGVPPYGGSLVEGELPPEMELTEAGVIQGMPAELGVFPFTVRVEDLNGSSDETAFTLEVVLIPGVPDLRLEKVGTVPVPGQPTEYFILIENVGKRASNETEIIEYLESWFTLRTTSEQPMEVVAGPDVYPSTSIGADYQALLKWRIPSPAQTGLRMMKLPER